ncbi:gliding motility-associated C-terminal domain-containing protein [Aurantibacillus circumpalustris]|uniref:T9SS type B sorting domain-containing protein n=1 Tax=Aurantibacillus circumpalustris TaxID=3036359 RepID=UPI00295B6391|nr:gliding motility-associated C-terminal domain-containing protein [Aurantibacillus circumpalustris]
MKNLLKTLSFIGLSLSLSLNAQTSSNNAKSQVGLTVSEPSNQYKSAYLANQDFLSSNSMSVYKNNFGDSLNGFNENKIKNELLAQGIPGWEIQSHIYVLKRRFINNKYDIGLKPVYMPVNNPNVTTTGGKTIGGGNIVNLAPCVNEGFESSLPGVYTSSNGVTGWTVSSRQQDGACSPTGWTPGSPAFSLIATPIISWGTVPGPIMGVIPNSPLGGTLVAQLNNHQASDYNQTKLAQTFPVTSNNTVFQFAYAGYWEDPGSGHTCCNGSGTAQQPGFSVKMYDCQGAPLACSNLSLNPGCQSAGVSFSVASNGNLWSNWQVKYIDLTPYVGSCITIEFIQSDCSLGGHWGSSLIDCQCGGQIIGPGLTGLGGFVGGPVSFCSGSNQAQISAPAGYQTYQWYAPGTGSIAAPQGTMQNITINSPIAGSIYTVQMIAASGCVFTSTNAIAVSTVAIAGVGTTSTCPGGASGSATVSGNGSGTGYNYTWINTLNSITVGTTAIASNLGAGTYSIIITALGSAGCGSAVTTVTVGTAPAGITQLLKPFCGSEAYLGTNGGSNFQWYNGSTPIPAPLGTNPSYTVSPPINGSIYWLSYLSAQGCQDSIKYTLLSSPAGAINIPTPKLICPGANNGLAQINLAPASGAPPGFNSYYVSAIGTTPPYTSSLNPTASNTYTFGGLSAGSYTVKVFDGSCKYGGSFNIAPLVYNFTLTPASTTLCPGNSFQAAVVFASPPSLSQYTYSWTPTTHLFGGSAQNAIITPVIPVGTQTTIIYSVKVTPTLVACPITKTISVTAINPPTPTITTIPNSCNTFSPYSIVTNPPGGVFNTGITGTNNPISASGGVLTPSLASNGINTFTYTITQYTCSASNTATYEVSKFWSSALSSNVPALCVTNPAYNLMNIVQSTVNGTWKGQVAGSVNGGGTFFNPSVFNNSSFPTSGSYLITYSTNSSPNPTVCPSTSTLNVVVTKTTTPYIVPINEFCTNAGIKNMSVTPSGGGWLPNTNNAVSSTGLLTCTNVPVPGLVVTYTVADGPCVNTNTTSLKVSQHYPVLFNGPVNSLCFNSSPFNLMSVLQSTAGGSWRDSTGVLGNKFYPSNLATGTYVATYHTTSWPTAGLCNETKTIAVSVLNPIVPVITQIATICNNASPIQMSVTPNTGHWTASPYLGSDGVLTPSLSSVGVNAVQYVVGTSTCNVQETKFINVEAFVPATIANKIPDLCNTSPIMNLLPLTLSSQGIWSGTGISGTSFNPAIAGSGSFILTHKTSSFPSGLCPDEAVVAVNVYSLAAPELKQIPTLCNNALPTQIQVSPVGGLFGGPDLGIVNLGGVFNPASAIIGDNVINYSITSGPCVAYAQTVIKVAKFISADLDKLPGPFCKNSEIVNLSSYVINPGGKWSVKAGAQGDGLLTGTSMFNPSLANEINTLEYRTSPAAPNEDLCPDTKEVVIEVKSAKALVLNSSAQGSCAPVEVTFNTPSTNSGEFIWTFDDGTEPLVEFNNNSGSHIFTKPGTYKIQLNYKDDVGCKSNSVTTNVVYVYEVPKADFTFPDEILVSDPQIQLTNLSTTLSDNKYSWKITGVAPVTVSDGLSPFVALTKSGKYQVTLIATSVNECRDEITKTIEVKNVFNVFIPNSFSPNFDGLNDYFMPTFTKEGLDMKSFEMEIFDRWGHSIFHTKDATAKGWDGSVQNKGEPLKEEVYIYRIKYKDMDGNAYNKMGHLSLVK